jgi:hypothetical protein
MGGFWRVWVCWVLRPARLSEHYGLCCIQAVCAMRSSLRGVECRDRGGVVSFTRES